MTVQGGVEVEVEVEVAVKGREFGVDRGIGAGDNNALVWALSPRGLSADAAVG